MENTIRRRPVKALREINYCTYENKGHAVAQLVEALRYKSEGRGFDWHNPSGRTMALGLIQPLTEMSTRNISWE